MEYLIKEEEGKNYNIGTLIVAAIVIVLSLIPLVMNYKYNDNHLNWLNHDYCKNLMTSTEQGSLYMTEGGDNQVFGTLYFTYAEKLRPDLTPYDQKGNIFKRIYGDMRYISRDILIRRQKMVDTGIFDSQEPFYEHIRSMQDPYFVPYWQGDRPVYLTWQRPQPWTLGDYYYKRYGLMYRVMDIEYNLVDYLDIKKEISVPAAQQQFKAWLHRDVSMKYTLDKIKKLEKEGYVKKVGNMVKYIKMFPSPHNIDYMDKFLIRWHEAPNAMHWDYLTREIIVNYDYQMGEVYKRKVIELQDIRSREKRSHIAAQIDKRIQDNWKKAVDFYEDGVVYGHDSISILHNISVVYLNNPLNDKSLHLKAHKLLTDGLKLFPNSLGTYSIMFSYLIKANLENPENEKKNLEEIDMWFTQLKNVLTHTKSAKINPATKTKKGVGASFERMFAEADYKNNPAWKNFAGIEGYVNEMKRIPTSQLLMYEQQLKSKINSNPNSVTMQDIQIIQALYMRGIPFHYVPFINRADGYLTTLLKYKRNDIQFNDWVFKMTLQFNKLDFAYEAGKNLLKLRKGADYNFYYTMGAICYRIKKNNDAKKYFNLFLTAVRSIPKATLKEGKKISDVEKVLELLK